MADVNGIDVAAIEFMDRRSLELVKESGAAARAGVRPVDWAEAALLVTFELAAVASQRSSHGAGEKRGSDKRGSSPVEASSNEPLDRITALLNTVGVDLESVDVALPGDIVAAERMLALREAVPAAVNERVARAKHTVDSRIDKTAGDMIVRFEHVEELLRIFDAEFARRGLDAAVWGHVSDGNLHANVLPRSMDDVDAGREAILAAGRAVILLGGAPLAEHGVGRNRVKQELLRELYGESGIEEMRRVKRALDPDWKLAPGVLFSRT
jgi:D-lactate dehydrogenase (cytochrome)